MERATEASAGLPYPGRFANLSRAFWAALSEFRAAASPGRSHIPRPQWTCRNPKGRSALANRGAGSKGKAADYRLSCRKRAAQVLVRRAPRRPAAVYRGAAPQSACAGVADRRTCAAGGFAYLDGRRQLHADGGAAAAARGDRQARDQRDQGYDASAAPYRIYG